jgi:ribosomal protein S18 acetylase RimI-like enzyme
MDELPDALSDARFAGRPASAGSIETREGGIVRRARPIGRPASAGSIEVHEEVIVRRARPADAEIIHQVLLAAFRGLRGRGYSHQALEAAIVPPEETRRRIAQGAHVLVAEAGGRVVGTATGLEEHEALHVCSVAVHPDSQGQGVARRLMEALENIARQHGCHKLWLQTAWAMTEAIALYKRLGYRQEGYQPCHFYGEDFLMFGKVLGRA